MRDGSGIRIAVLTAATLALSAGGARAQLLEAATSTVTTPDGQTIDISNLHGHAELHVKVS